MKSLLFAIAAFLLPAFLFAQDLPPTLAGVARTELPGARATVSGTVTGNGKATTLTLTLRTLTDPAIILTRTLNQDGVTADSPFSFSLTRLTFGEKYLCKVVANNTVAPAAESADLLIEIPASAPPIIGTVTATQVSDGSANINALITGNGSETTVTLVYGETDQYGKTATAKVGATAVDEVTTFPITGLKLGATYHYKITAKNGTVPDAATADLTFAMPAKKPLLLVPPKVDVLTENSADITLTVDAQGAETTVKADFGAAAPAYGSTVIVAEKVPASQTGVKKSVATVVHLTGLIAQTYHYKVTATNSVGATATADLTFTLPQAPTVKPEVTVKRETANLTATVTAHGAKVDLTLAVTIGEKTTTVTRLAAVPQDGRNVAISFDLQDLIPNTRYSYTLTASHPKNTKTTTIKTGTFQTLPDFQQSLSGVNSGLIKNADGDIAGAFKLLANKGGKFTARISIGNESYVVTGELGADGKFRGTTPSGLYMEVTASLAAGAQTNTGGNNGGGGPGGGNNNAAASGSPSNVKFDFSFSRDDGTYSAATTTNEVTKARMTELAGLYTMTIPAPGNSTTAGQTATGLPQGAGFMRMTVKEWGGVSIQGLLGDGSKFTYGSTLTGTDTATGIPLWLSPKDARVQGIVTLAGTTDVTAAGDLKWYRPPDDGATKFAEGFYTTVNATGGAYTPPAKRERVLNADTSDATITFQGGNLTSNITRNFTIDKNNRVELPKGNVSKLTLYPTSGTFTGTFEHPYDGEMRSFQGVLLPNQSVATGVFAGQTQTGTVKITPGATVVTTPPAQQPGNGTGNPGVNLGNGAVGISPQLNLGR